MGTSITEEKMIEECHHLIKSFEQHEGKVFPDKPLPLKHFTTLLESAAAKLFQFGVTAHNAPITTGLLWLSPSTSAPDDPSAPGASPH